MPYLFIAIIALFCPPVCAYSVIPFALCVKPMMKHGAGGDDERRRRDDEACHFLYSSKNARQSASCCAAVSGSICASLRHALTY